MNTIGKISLLYPIAIATSLLLCEGCDSTNVSAGKPSSSKVSDSTTVISDGTMLSFQLNQSKSFIINGTRYSISFNDVNDGRCSSDQCEKCYGSLAKIFIRVTDDGPENEEAVLSILGCVGGNLSAEQISNGKFFVKFKNFSIGLSDLSPYPKNTIDQINKFQYTAKILFKTP